MRTAGHEIWGCARGPIARLAPPTRIVAGLFVFAACLSAPARSLSGVAAILLLAGGWLLACRPPAPVARNAGLYGLVLFAPAFLLAPVIRLQPGSAAADWREAFAITGSLVAHGLGGMIVSVATVTALSPSDLREGLLRLPVPRLAAAILIQIVHQTATMLAETRQISSALAVRGATGHGRAAWRVLASLPQVWLPRVLGRAESVAAAMEVRGYDARMLPAFHSAPMRARDGIALALAAGTLAAALALRWRAGS